MCKADNLPPSCAVVTKSGNLNFLETSGPLQVCKGTALPLQVEISVLNLHYSCYITDFCYHVQLYDGWLMELKLVGVG